MDVNRPPHISRMSDYTLLPGDSLKIHIVATDSTDPNGGALPDLSLAKSAGAAFTDSTGGKGSLRWKPTIADTGTYNFIVLCLDDDTPALSDVDTRELRYSGPIWRRCWRRLDRSRSARQHTKHTFVRDRPGWYDTVFYAQGIPTNATLVDSANGRGSFIFTRASKVWSPFRKFFTSRRATKSTTRLFLIQAANATANGSGVYRPTRNRCWKEGDSVLHDQCD